MIQDIKDFFIEMFYGYQPKFKVGEIGYRPKVERWDKKWGAEIVEIGLKSYRYKIIYNGKYLPKAKTAPFRLFDLMYKKEIR